MMKGSKLGLGARDSGAYARLTTHAKCVQVVPPAAKPSNPYAPLAKGKRGPAPEPWLLPEEARRLKRQQQ